MIKNIFSIINILLITVLIFFCVKLFYQVVSSKLLQVSSYESPYARDSFNRSNTAADLNKKFRKKNFNSYQSIYDRDLMKTKQAVQTEIKTDIDPDKLKETKLNLKLFGTITGENNTGYAVIEETKKKKQGLYRTGDSIQNAEIKMILRKKVVLSVNGKDEVLTMEDDKKKGSSKKASRSRPSNNRDSDERFGFDETVAIDRDKINNSLKNINQLMSQVKVRPHFKDGKPNGLLLSHVQQNSIFKEMGLKNGDIVKGVNGKEIQSVDDALKFYDNLKSSSNVQLQIERKGELLNIGYQIE